MSGRRRANIRRVKAMRWRGDTTRMNTARVIVTLMRSVYSETQAAATSAQGRLNMRRPASQRLAIPVSPWSAASVNFASIAK